MPIKLLDVEGVAASVRNIRNGNFPISRPLLLITSNAPSGAAKKFITFALSSQATASIDAFDFVPYLD
ncbi:MAG TPA: hypothetical protein VMV45_08505 [Casimicrobiaceae bacterium]|nr:hypothetical protein [Casimicrobiaceae bacterium]